MDNVTAFRAWAEPVSRRARLHHPAEERIVHHRYCRRSMGGGSSVKLTWERSGFGPTDVVIFTGIVSA